MLLQNDVKFGDYTSLLQYSLKFCDVLTLQIPNHNKMIINEKNHEGNLELDIGHCEVSNDPLYEIYYENANCLIEKLFGKHIIRTYFDTEYLASIYTTERKIYQIQMNQEVVENLNFAGSLFAWKFPFLPEDLSLFTKGKCWLQSIAHENMCWIYDNGEVIKYTLKRMKIKFVEDYNNDVPILRNG